MRTNVFRILMVLAILLIAARTGAEVPRLINYQGVLTNLEGIPLNGTHDLEFAIYADEAMSAPQLWSESHSGVVVVDGVFNVILGGTNPSGLPLGLFDEENRWLAVGVDGGNPMEPLMQVTSVPYALRAAVADSVVAGGAGGELWTLSGDGENALLVLSNGNAGIGVADPRRRLEIMGDGAEGGIRWATTYGGSVLGDIYHGGTGNGFIINSHAGGGTWADLHLQTNAATRLFVDSSGRVGIGNLVPAELLDVSGTVQMTGFKMPSGGGVGWVLTDDGTGTGTWQPSGGTTGDGDWIISGDDMYAANTGNVGVGTTSPGAALDVQGDGRVLRALGLGSRAAIDGKHNDTGNLGYVGAPTAGLIGKSENQPGVYAESDTVAVYGFNSSPTRTEGYLGGVYGAYGESAVGNYGYLGGASFGVYGKEMINENYGFIGYWNYGVLGHSDSQAGVKGRAVGGTGVHGETSTGWAVAGTHISSGNYGYIGTSSDAVYGESDSGNAIHGRSISGQAGYFRGDVTITSGDLTVPVIQITGGSDLSEQFDIARSTAGLEPEPGHLVCLDPQRPGQLKISSESYDKKVAGVISGAGGIKPGMLMGQTGSLADGGSPVALTGRVYCWADATVDPIEPGDLLTTSDTHGHAMKASDRERSHGTIIGKAMTPLKSGRGLVLVLVNLQ